LNSTYKNILIAPLNWGLGHATRCIPIIRALQENNYTPIIASDGSALELLRKEFPHLKTLKLPSYNIEYAEKGANLKWKLIRKFPKLIIAILNEKRLVNRWIEKHQIEGIISDNRLGVFSNKIPSIYITHQLNVLSGKTTWFSSKLHQFIIKKFVECWVPDVEGIPNLSGSLGHQNHSNLKVKYIGPLSRMQKKEIPKIYDLMIILSGPEPQRGLLEAKLKKEVSNFGGKIIFIKGIIKKTQKKQEIGNITFYNFMNTRQLEQTFNESEIVLCRSGYTTIMDIAKLDKKAFFIPTPGQYEQEYLAEKLEQEGIAPFATQDKVELKDIFKTQQYKGFSEIKNTINWANLFDVFEK
jgi:uncharacterized protein (TIGR00661 family)